MGPSPTSDRGNGLDISNAYYVLNLQPLDWDYTCFSFPNPDGSMQWYNFLVLPQGFKTSAGIFETAITPLRYYITSETHKPLFGYYDDMRQIAQHASESTELAIRNTEFLFGAIAAAGFPISWGKSIILPTCQFPIVGHDIDTEGSI